MEGFEGEWRFGWIGREKVRCGGGGRIEGRDCRSKTMVDRSAFHSLLRSWRWNGCDEVASLRDTAWSFLM